MNFFNPLKKKKPALKRIPLLTSYLVKIKIKTQAELGLVTHAYDSSTSEAEAGEWRFGGRSELHS